MKFLPLVWAGIWRKPGRALLTLASVINAFLLYGLLQGFVSGLNGAVEDTHADVLITASRVSQLEPLPLSELAAIRATSGVRAAAPIIIFHGAFRSQALANVRGFAVDPASFAAADPDEVIAPATIRALEQTRAGVLLPARVAALFGLKVGDAMPLKSMLWINRNAPAWPLQVVGLYQGNPRDTLFGSALLANYDYVDQARSQSSGTASFYLVRVNEPSQAGEVAKRIDARFANSLNETKTESERQVAADSIKQIGDIGLVVRAIVSAVFFALLFSVGAMMMQSVRERTPELAVLKTLGFSDRGVLALIVGEALVTCLFAASVGLLLAAMLFPVIRLGIGFDVHAGPVLLLGLVLAIGLALITGVPPAIRGMRLTIVDALAGR